MDLFKPSLRCGQHKRSLRVRMNTQRVLEISLKFSPACSLTTSLMRGFTTVFLKNNLMYVFIFGRAGSSLRHGLFSSCCAGFSLQSTASRHAAGSSYGTCAQRWWLLGSRAQAQ